ncbi:MAG TPA: aminotransferase class I/II-fold pyridoxal phosphate-dependent enzyme [Puia sp.]|nr:aminotransferase class I/II-fold pyridoxal phosphate-dependent enzyme [Puia sp.]
MLYGHGDNGYQYGREIIADFSTNVWYGGEPEGLKEHLFRQWKRINKYPEPLAGNLAGKVSRHHGLQPENILITSGATESIYLMAQLFRNKRSCVVIPSFSEYEDACRIHEHAIDFLNWESLASLGGDTIPEAPGAGPDMVAEADLFWIGNPNNPTGAVFTAPETLISRYPQTMFAIDESFIEFTDAITSAIGLVQETPNLAILRSMTKAFAIPGLRLGYIAAHRDIIEKLKALKLPWSVNAMALEAGNFIFDHYSSIRLPLTKLSQDKADLIGQLREFQIKIYSGETHFFLCETAWASAEELKRWLLERSGLLIRDACNFRGLGAGHFRLATLAPDQNRLLVNALEEWQAQYI